MHDRLWTLPEPPEGEPVRGLSPWRVLASVVLALSLLVAAFVVPIPVFFAYLPGPVRDVQELVEVDSAATYSSEGSLYLTTVSVDTQVTFAELVAAWVDDDKDVVMSQEVTQGQSLEAVRDQQRNAMKRSKVAAKEVALSAAGLGRPTGDGAKVEATLKGSPAAAKLQRGDVIVAVDGEPVATTCDVGSAIDRHAPGETVEMSVRRSGRKMTVATKTIANPQDPSSAFVGVQMSDVGYEFDVGVDVTFKTGQIAGPSAGLMFALALYDRITPDDLTQGKEIAGTGEIFCDGGVGAIGGIEEKVAAAERVGADVFLAPAGNADAARAAADEIEIVAVSNFSDAVRYLEGLSETS